MKIWKVYRYLQHFVTPGVVSSKQSARLLRFLYVLAILFVTFSAGWSSPSPTHPQDLLKSQTLSTKTHAENARFWRDRNWRNKIIVSGLALGLFEFVHWLPIMAHRTYLFLHWFPTICQWNLFIGSYCFPPKIHALC